VTSFPVHIFRKTCYSVNENLARKTFVCFRRLPECKDDRSATSKQKYAVLERKNIIVTSDAWRVAIDLDTQVYEDAIASQK